MPKDGACGFIHGSMVHMSSRYKEADVMRKSYTSMQKNLLDRSKGPCLSFRVVFNSKMATKMNFWQKIKLKNCLSSMEWKLENRKTISCGQV